MTDIRVEGLAKSASESGSLAKAAQDGWDKSLAGQKTRKEQPSAELDFSVGDPLAKTKKDSSTESHVSNNPVTQSGNGHVSDKQNKPAKTGPDAHSNAGDSGKPAKAVPHGDTPVKPGQERQAVKPEHRSNGTQSGGGTGTGGDTIPTGKPVHRPDIKPGEPKPTKYPK